ncbi:MAG: glycoside hydrolase family 43 protein [Tannerella sp.]|jgi:beta-xylosidase|nr:glycoside hydrolase family 43 protein [Tannerella sp.]
MNHKYHIPEFAPVIIALFLNFAIFCACNSSKNKSFVPGGTWPDNNGVHINAHGGGILQMGDTYYWFGEHKTEGEAGNKALVGVSCYSSKDLYNWKDEGIALRVIEDDTAHRITKGCILERPKVIYNKKNKNYVMWFHLEPKGAGYTGALSGIAVSDKPAGPYKFLKAIRPNAGHWPVNVLDVHKSENIPSAGQRFSGGDLPAHPDSLNLLGRDMPGGQMARDMNLFVDDDGKAYHIYSSEENSTLHISELNEDYTDCSGKFARFFSGRFMEAPAMFKKDGKYYLIMSGCTGWAPNAGRSAVASSIWGPWVELKNPFVGKEADLSFRSQSTYVLPVPGTADRFIYMGDRWTPKNAIDGRYIWLPIHFEGDQPIIRWLDEWRYEF